MEEILTRDNLLSYTTIVPADYIRKGKYTASMIPKFDPNAKCLKIMEGITEIAPFAINPELFLSEKNNNICQVDLPSTLKTINNDAFYDCAMEIVTCKAPIVKIKQSAFRLCDLLQDIDMIMDIEGNQLIDIWRPITSEANNFRIPKCIQYFKLGKMLDGKIYSRAYESCEEDILPTEIRTKNEYRNWEYPNTLRHFVSVEEDQQ